MMNRDERRARERLQKKAVAAARKRANRPGGTNAVVEASQRLFALGRSKEALPELLRAIEDHPDDLDVRGALAYALAATGHLTNAIEQYRLLLEIKPKSAPVLTNLALLVAKTGKPIEAIPLLENAAKLAPNHANTAFALAELMAWQNRLAEAFSQYRRAAVLLHRKVGPNPGIQHCDDLLKLATGLIWTGDLGPGIKALDLAVELRPDHVLTLIRRGLALVKLRRFPEAIASFTRAATLEPNLGVIRRGLGTALLTSGDAEGAQEQLRMATELDPRDELARYFLAAARHENPDAPPPSYVRGLFDDYAQHFEHHLVDVLQYRAPEQVCAAVLALAGPGAADWQVIDLGCGTGLCGPLIRDAARRLIGVDLSVGMLEKAREKAMYDELRLGDVVQVLTGYENAFDLALCTDVMIYLGNLTPIFAAAARALKPGALFAFTTEVHSGEGFALDSSARYLHARSYVESEAAGHGFAVVHFEPITARYQHLKPDIHNLFIVRREGERTPHE